MVSTPPWGPGVLANGAMPGDIPSPRSIPALNPNYRLAPQHFLYFWPLPHEQGAFGLGFFLPVGLVNAWRGSLRMTSPTRLIASVASASPCAAASA